MSSEHDANDLTLRQLRQMASNLGIGRYSRMLKVADGPDEVHKMVIARRELNKYA